MGVVDNHMPRRFSSQTGGMPIILMKHMYRHVLTNKSNTKDMNAKDLFSGLLA